MTLATGRLSRLSRGFTIVEIVLVLGLMALAGGLVIANFTSMAERGASQTTQEILRSAINQARYLAASERQIIEMSYDEDAGELTLSSGDSFPLGEMYGSGTRGNISFYLIPSARGTDPFTDPLATRMSTAKIQFAPDRSSSPFVVEIDTGGGNPQRHLFDPFSSLERTEK